MKPFVDRQRKYFEAQKAARDERAAEERKFMTSFNPNTADRKDFTRFRFKQFPRKGKIFILEFNRFNS